MSDASHHGEAPASAGHDHHFDGAPADTVGPDEPHTPGWLTLLGIGLVLAVLFLFALKQPEQKTRAELTEGAAASAPSPSAAPPTRPMPPPRPQGAQDVAARVLGAASGLPLMARPGMSAPTRQPMPRPTGPAGLAAPRPAAPTQPPAQHIHRPGEPPH